MTFIDVRRKAENAASEALDRILEALIINLASSSRSTIPVHYAGTVPVLELLKVALYRTAQCSIDLLTQHVNFGFTNVTTRSYANFS